MTTHTYRTVDVPVTGGALRVGVWEPAPDRPQASAEANAVGGTTPGQAGSPVPTVLVLHGVTSSHLAWQLLAPKLTGVRVLAPDLRGRGASNGVQGAAGMRAHAEDLVAVLDAFGCDSVPVIGHSMGGFVAVVLSHVAPERVERLVLVDGGLPLNAPAGLTPDQLVTAILGPTAARLSMRFDSTEAYLDFWKAHPAFVNDWAPELDRYFAYDLVPDGEQLRSSTSLATTTEDTVDLNTGSALPEALGALEAWGKPVLFVSVPRGLQDETPGLYAPDHLEQMLAHFPSVRHTHLPDLNHYTVVMGERGAEALAEVLQREILTPVRG